MAKTITCECGATILCQAFTNTCYCGKDYNHAGQLLASRSQWGYETGETADEILAETSHMDLSQAVCPEEQEENFYDNE